MLLHTIPTLRSLKRFGALILNRQDAAQYSSSRMGLIFHRGISSSSAGQSVDLERAINEAQRRSVAVYSFFAPTATSVGSGGLIADAQSSLQRLSDDTGGQAFFQGLGVPTSFEPFIRELSSALDRQIALTYLVDASRQGISPSED